MADEQRVPVILWVLLAALLLPLGMILFLPFAVWFAFQNPALSALVGTVIASALIRSIVRAINRRDARRPETVSRLDHRSPG
jgi:hypothetical protein